MIALGLTAAQLRDFTQLLLTSHHVRVDIHLLGLTHTRVSNVSDMFFDGQITIDRDAEISRSASLTFFDPKHQMALDSNSPADGAMYMDRMLQIYYTIASPDWSRKYTVPVFCGPITKMDRDNAILKVECQGKEALSMDPVWVARTYRKGARKVDVIRALLKGTGETKFSLRSSTSKLSKDLAVSSQHKPWQVAKDLAHSLGYQLFYDGRGVCVMRSYPTYPCFNFREGTGNALLSKPQVGFDMTGVVNSVLVKGATPKGKSQPIIYRAVPPNSHPLSPRNLGRNGVPRYILSEIDDDSITSVSEAKAAGEYRLARALYESTTVAFDSLPVPHLEPGDVFGLYTSESSTKSSVGKMTIPLNVNSSASVGYLRNLRPNTANIRKRR